MTSWKRVVTRMVDRAEDHFDKLKYRLHDTLGGSDPIKIVTYRGFGTPDRLFVRGRVLEDKGETLGTENDTLWDNLVNMYKRMESDEIPFARLSVQFQDIQTEVVADEEGHFQVWLEPSQPLPTNHVSHPIEITLVEPKPKHAERVHATAEVFVPPASAQYMVISDIDDTVIHTDATHILRMARNTFLGNARSRLPFHGVAAFYRALYMGKTGNEMNPLFYVSSSPWNLYDLLVEFFRLQDFPLGPVLALRDWGINEDEILPTRHRKYKMEAIRQFIDTYDNLPIILIGDSGQEDPEIYTEVAEKYPERVMAVYIRNVSRSLERPAAIQELAKKVIESGSTLILADNSLIMAEHAAAQGWIAPETLAGIQLEKVKDEAPANPIEELINGEEKEEGPTVVIKEGDQTSNIDEGGIETALEEGDPKDQATPTVIIKPEEDTSS